MDDINAFCAYTGEVLRFERIVGSPVWRCLNGFAPGEWISGTQYDWLKKAVLQRPNGKVVKKAVCPYKGTPIELEEHMGMVRAAGAFSPMSCFWLTKQEALWECSHRNGRAPNFPRELKISVGDIQTRESDPAYGIGSTTSEIVGKTLEVMQQ